MRDRAISLRRTVKRTVRDRALKKNTPRQEE